jgi:hypothetical protein
MTATAHGHRRLDELSAQDLVEVRMLINRLSKIEYWICQHAARLRADARNAQDGGGDPAREADVKVDVRCVLRESDPEFDPCGENIVATLDGRAAMEPRASTRDAGWNDPREPAFHALSDMRVGRLFRDLYEHGVARDWDALVRFGEISVDISLAHVSRAHDGA